MIVLKINWSKIDVNLLYQGEKEDFLNCALKENKDGKDRFGYDGFITQDVSKEDRAKGVKGPIIGNWKRIGEPEAQRPAGREDTSDYRRLPQRPTDRRPERPAPQRQERPAPTRQRQGYDPNAEPDIEDPNFK